MSPALALAASHVAGTDSISAASFSGYTMRRTGGLCARSDASTSRLTMVLRSATLSVTTIASPLVSGPVSGDMGIILLTIFTARRHLFLDRQTPEFFSWLFRTRND